ncbi:MAG TPA: hypothetical protein VJ813_11415 [Vicinamibacterales bacterium]|nr:hypothetical protein [Vicinamibacterales bacterium]
MRIALVTTALGIAVVSWAGISAQQEMLPKPGPGSGVTHVLGSVEVKNAPEVHAAQRGDWQVAINNTPSVRVSEVAGPSFIRPGQRFQITWADGQTETVTASAAARDGWVQVGETPGRWINLANARAVASAR